MTKPVVNLDIDTDTPDLVCVECRYAADRTAGPRKPEPGDMTLCCGCGSLNIFTEDMRWRRPNDEEFFEAAAHSELQAARRAIIEMNARRRR